MGRKSIDIQGVTHGKTPIPQGSVIDRLVFSSGIAGIDPETGTIPSDPKRQAELVFNNVRVFMEAAGGTPEDIGRVTVYLTEEKHREFVNDEWIKMFPNPESRPARHATISELRNGAVIQIELIAVLSK